VTKFNWGTWLCHTTDRAKIYFWESMSWNRLKM